MNTLLWELVPQMLVQHASKVRVKAFIPRDEHIGEREPGHQASLLEPEDGAEAVKGRGMESQDL